jgi:hypothetical protein
VSITTHPRGRVALATLAGLALTLGAALPAGAAKAPKLTVEGRGEWSTHPVGSYEVVRGAADVQTGRRTYDGALLANVGPDDSTLPAAGACEHGWAQVWVDGADDQLAVTGVGDICGHHVQAPESVVVYSFTGVAYVEESATRRTYNKEGFVDIRMAVDGSAYVFATVA